jgi:CheY-like chemotaxis protein
MSTTLKLRLDDLAAAATGRVETPGSVVMRVTGRRPLVLVVDADVLSRSWLARAIVREGCDVEVAGDVDEALGVCGNTRVDAVVVSTGSDSREVVSLLETLGARWRDLVVIGRSGSPDAYETFLRSFGFDSVAAIALDASMPGARVARLVKSFVAPNAESGIHKI